MALDIDSLNPAQREAVVTTEGPLLVLAGAGSGKTRVLTYRIAHMIEDIGIMPWHILAITFTNKAAREMRERLDKLMDGLSTRGMWVCTFHAMCVRMLRIDAERLGYTNNFTIYDADDSKRLVKSILQELHIDEKRFPVNAVQSRISAAKNELMDSDDLMEACSTPADEVAAKVFKELEKRLKRANAMDFDDLLVNAYTLLKNNPDVLEGYQDRFTHISVDEYQDTNRAQYQICKLLAAKHKNLMVVGDDDQSIYSWRGADIRNILDFEKDYPTAKTVKLEQNYRSTGHILDAANAVVAHNTERKAKRLFTSSGDGEKIRLALKRDELAEANYIAGEIKGLHDQGTPYSDMALFYRTNAQSRVLEDGLVKAGIPYTIVGGTRFFDRAEIRDLTAYLKLAVNPADDVSARRVINKPARSIGATTQERIAELASRRGVSFFEAAAEYVLEPGVTSKTRNGIVRFLQVVADAQSYDGDLADIVEMIADESGLIDALRAEGTDEAQDRIENIREFFGVVKEYVANHEPSEELLSNAQSGLIDALRAEGTDEAQDRIENIREFFGVVKEYVANHEPSEELLSNAQVQEEATEPGEAVAGDLNLAGFMEWLALRTDLDSAGDGESAVTLMTVHAAKGLEFNTVFVAGMEEGIFPHVWLALRTDLDSAGDGESAVTLMTVHAAKGLEFNTVFVAGMEEGIFPHVNDFVGTDPAKLEEERRLAYVAITRARRKLYLCHAESRRLFGDVQHNRRSRFVDEIPSEHTTSVGVGSEGFGGFGYDRRGSRHGIGGAGHGVEVYGGQVFGNRTRSSGRGASGGGRSFDDFFGGSSRATSPSTTASPAPEVYGGQVFGNRTRSSGRGASGGGRSFDDFFGGSSRATSPSTTASPAPKAPSVNYSQTKASESFAIGDRVSHKKFGLGTVTACKGDQITIHLDSGGDKTLLKGYAPIVKIKG